MWKKAIVLAGLIAALGAGVAEAEGIAYTTSSAVLRSDPSSGSHVVARIPRDAELTTGHCSKGWCFAHFGDDSGYISASVLDFADNAPTTGTVVERTYVYPDYYPGPYVYGPPVVFGYRGWHGGWHGGYWRH